MNHNEEESANNNDEITITLVDYYSKNKTENRSESIRVSSIHTTLDDLIGYAIALLGIDVGTGGGQGNISLYRDGILLNSTDGGSTNNGGTNQSTLKTLREAGMKHDDLILVSPQSSSSSSSLLQPSTLQAGINAATTSFMNDGNTSVQQGEGGGSSGGMLDFSAILSSPAAATTTTSSFSNPNGNRINRNNSSIVPGGGTTTGRTNNITFVLPPVVVPGSNSGGDGGNKINNHSNDAKSDNNGTNDDVRRWKGMSLDDVIETNSNPSSVVKLLLDTNAETAMPNLMKELNYHDPLLAGKIRDANGIKEATKIWRDSIQTRTLSRTLNNFTRQNKENEMERRLRLNPTDAEANEYFGERIQLKNIQNQYEQVVEMYPESLGRILMLYVDSKVNGQPVQAFVDSGAQMTIASKSFAERCGLMHLVDKRFAGIAVGVGTGKILGRVHLVPLEIGGNFFPCSVTVMEENNVTSKGGREMEFLFGLDMLRRHGCSIDLSLNALSFRLPSNTDSSTQSTIVNVPFLHEKDLEEDRGGTRGFDIEKSNREVEEKMMMDVDECTDYDAKSSKDDGDNKNEGNEGSVQKDGK